jgi:hypothetical protein
LSGWRKTRRNQTASKGLTKGKDSNRIPQCDHDKASRAAETRFGNHMAQKRSPLSKAGIRVDAILGLISAVILLALQPASFGPSVSFTPRVAHSPTLIAASTPRRAYTLTAPYSGFTQVNKSLEYIGKCHNGGGGGWGGVRVGPSWNSSTGRFEFSTHVQSSSACWSGNNSSVGLVELQSW